MTSEDKRKIEDDAECSWSAAIFKLSCRVDRHVGLVGVSVLATIRGKGLESKASPCGLESSSPESDKEEQQELWHPLDEREHKFPEASSSSSFGEYFGNCLL